jgi:hypothetical protein
MKIFITGLFLLLSTMSVPAQSNAQIEKELAAAIKEVQKYSNYGNAYDGDKLSRANEVFEKKLLKYTKVPSTLTYKFSALDDLLTIAASEDGRFRIFSWDMQDGGTMHDYARVYQYKGADGKVYSKTDAQTEDSYGGGFVTDIFTLATKIGAVYIVCSTSVGSTSDHYQSADLYKIAGSALNDKIKLIKTRSGLTSTLGFEYNFFSVVDRQERPVRLISFDKRTKILKIPVVIEDEKFPNGKVTNKFISYQFNGGYFVKVS